MNKNKMNSKIMILSLVFFMFHVQTINSEDISTVLKNGESIASIETPMTEKQSPQKWVIEEENGETTTMIQTEQNNVVYEKINRNDIANDEVYSVQTKVIEEKNDDDCLSNKKQNLGIFKLTYYCAGTITKTGTSPTPNRTIAVDPRVIPLGSKVEINGQMYIAEDTGGDIKGNRIDVFVGSYDEAINKGVDYEEVSLQN